ncbi:MAG: choice-of-anchor D domain-containing protein [Gammaproteobacteria bacterium]|nr:choice-of-anchor D domain-containing protein [Gammaproteobacteria bacterium]
MKISVPNSLITIPVILLLSSCGGGGGSKAPQIALSAATLAFPDQVIVEASSSQSISVSNSGNADLVVSSVAVSGTDGASFVLTNNCTTPVVPASSCSIGISFKPTSTGAKTGTLTVLSNASGQPTVALSGSGVLPPPPTVTGTSISMDVFGIISTTATGAVTATDRYRLPLTYTVSTQAVEGTATVAAGGGVTYRVNGLLSSPTKATDSFVVSVSNGYTTGTASVNVTLRYDPLLPNQWHLANTGQNSFSSTRPISGNDMKVGVAWAEGATGKGIKVAIVDDGLEGAHEDLKDNFDLEKSFNFLTNGKDPTPANADDTHGTAVAGIVAAQAFNGKGGRGVAFQATLRGYNLLEEGADSIQNLATGLGGGTGVAADNDVFNASFGAVTDRRLPLLPKFDPAEGQTNATTTTLRGGKGAPLVEAAGNDFSDFLGNSPTCGFAVSIKISCSIAALDTRKASSIPIIVGALAADGKKSSYSTTGSSLWVSAPGGEGGDDSAFIAGLNAVDYKPAIITTTRTGCDSKGNASNALDSKTNSLSAACQYTAKMNGTSAAAPNTAGVVALMLQVRPELTWRDVKFILAKTAVKVDAAMPPISIGSVIAEQGWVKNAAGFEFNNWYGFGAVDAGAAVKLAKTHALVSPQKTAIEKSFSPTTTVTLSPNAASYTIDFVVSSPDMTFNEGVILYNDFDTSLVSCVQIELLSPSGTKSILLHAGTGFTNTIVENVRLASNAFYGESVNGTWKMTYRHLCTSGSTRLYSSFPQTILLVGR